MVVALFAAGCGFRGESVDLIVHNARVVTLDPMGTVGQAVAVRAGRVVEVGAERAILNKYRAGEVVDAAQATVYPGWMDAHAHLVGYAKGLGEVDLVGTGSWAEVVARVEEGANERSEGWVVGRGWDQNDWEQTDYPTRALLDAAFPDRAVVLQRVDGHALVANGAALRAAGIDGGSVFDGGEVVRDAAGEATGVLVDAAAEALLAVVPEPDSLAKVGLIKRAEERLVAAGLTTVVDAGLPVEDILLLDAMQRAGDLKLRVVAMAADEPQTWDWFAAHEPLVTDRLVARSVKFYLDGALGSRGAALNAPYADRPDWKGLLLEDSAAFGERLDRCAELGLQAATHCIGDRAMDLALNLYGQILGGTNDRRWRIEHAQVLGRDNLPLMQAYNVLPSVQPTHATSDMYWAGQRLGRNRIRRAYAYKDLLETNGLIALGTDFPVEAIDPRATFYAATARKDAEGTPVGGFQPEQGLTAEEALKGMTLWAAIVNFQEESLGSIEPGKWADFTILDRDVLQVSPEQARESAVLGTVVAGEWLYRTGKLAQ